VSVVQPESGGLSHQTYTWGTIPLLPDAYAVHAHNKCISEGLIDACHRMVLRERLIKVNQFQGISVDWPDP